MDNIRVKNYRCFKDSGAIHIAPLTLLLGKNNSGKSSFLKILPLLCQSVDEYVNGAFLWYGESVDFGDFKNVLREGTNCMSIEFDIPEAEIDTFRGSLIKKKKGIVHCEIELHTLGEKEEFFSSFKIKSSEVLLECKFDGKSVKELVVGNISSNQFPQEELSVINTYSILPKIIFSNHPLDSSPAAQNEMDSLLPHRDENWFKVKRVLFDMESKSRTVRLLQQQGGLSKDDAEKIYDINLYLNANKIIDSVNRYLVYLKQNVYYTKPIRALGERYYRYRNVEVNRLDPSGDNIALYLANLSREKRKSLNDFLKYYFHFTVETKGEVNLEILINTSEGQRNLVDVGVGYTQLLPILINVWEVKEADSIGPNNRFSKSIVPYYLAIEQPELHLHPKLQYDFARVVADIITDSIKNGINLRVIVETHSEYIINKIGEMIAQGNLDKEIVSVLLFNNTGNEQIIHTSFSNDGFLTNWPYGFFDEE